MSNKIQTTGTPTIVLHKLLIYNFLNAYRALDKFGGIFSTLPKMLALYIHDYGNTFFSACFQSAEAFALFQSKIAITPIHKIKRPLDGS